MAKIIGPHQSPRAPSLRGAFLIRPGPDGQVAQAWPKKAKKRLSKRQREAIEKFREAAIICKFAPAADQMRSRQLAHGSQFLPRDLQYMAIYGRLATLYFTDGQRRYQLASRIELSELLDILGFAPGSVLFRGPDYWEVLPPPSADSALVIVGGQVQWSTAGLGGGASNIPMATLPTATADSASAYASKGMVFTPRRQVALSRFLAISRGVSSGQNQQRVTLAKCSGQGDNLVVGDIVAQTPWQTVGIISLTENYFALPTETDLEPGQQYIAILSGNYASGTTALTMRYYNGPLGSVFLGIPADLDGFSYQFSTTNPQPGLMPDVTGPAIYFVIPVPAD